jgi:uncharacterized protein YjdB
MNRIIVLLLAGILCVFSSGCAPLLVGAAVGGVGMYAASKDSIQGDTDILYEDLWDSSVRVAGMVGKIKKMDASVGAIELDTLENSQVWIKLVRLTRATTRLRVAARRHRLPNLTLAQDIYMKIVNGTR